MPLSLPCIRDIWRKIQKLLFSGRFACVFAVCFLARLSFYSAPTQTQAPFSVRWSCLFRFEKNKKNKNNNNKWKRTGFVLFLTWDANT